ncbi:DeoR/GlpR family DNA-binding transcription regulator [candidate division KSB1 bacterium]|nr:DeoR/GlpR family DNA-binding transcription regulator [candidate division KSB1 bacterium]
MFPTERIEKLESLLFSRKYLQVNEVAAELRISRATAIRDLDLLIQQGIARRIRGGVIRIDAKPELPTCPFFTPHSPIPNLAEKQKIARAAVTLLPAQATLFIDGGTSTMQLCPFLKDGDFRIITNSVTIACYFLENSHLEVILVGGLLHRRGGITIGPLAMQVVENIHADWFIASAGGIDESGLTNTDLLTVEIEREMMQRSHKQMFLIDSSKFGRKALTYLADFQRLDILVTDVAPAEKLQAQLNLSQVQVVIAMQGLHDF